MIVMVMASPSSYVTVIVSPSLDELDVVPSCAGGVVGAGAGLVAPVEVAVQVCEVVVVLRCKVVVRMGALDGQTEGRGRRTSPQSWSSSSGPAQRSAPCCTIQLRE